MLMQEYSGVFVRIPHPQMAPASLPDPPSVTSDARRTHKAAESATGVKSGRAAKTKDTESAAHETPHAATGQTALSAAPDAQGRDVVVVQGPKGAAHKCREELLRRGKEHGSMLSVPIARTYYAHIIGRNGARLKAMEAASGARIFLPRKTDGSRSDVIAVGSASAVDAARRLIEQAATDLAEATSCEMPVQPEHYFFLQANQQHALRSFGEACSGVSVALTRGKASGGAASVRLRGRRDHVASAKERLAELFAHFVTEHVEIPSKWRGLVLNRDAAHIRQLATTYSVRIYPAERSRDSDIVRGRAPAPAPSVSTTVTAAAPTDGARDAVATADAPTSAPLNDGLAEATEGPEDGEIVEQDVAAAAPVPVNDGVAGAPPAVGASDGGAIGGDAGAKAKTTSRNEPIVMMISGHADNVAQARAALLELLPVNIAVRVPAQYLGSLIGQGGKGIRQIMEACRVRVTVPSRMAAGADTSELAVHGVRADAERAHDMLLQRVQELESAQRDRELRSFSLTMDVDPKYYPVLIGKGGATISKIKTDTGTRIFFPKPLHGHRASPDADGAGVDGGGGGSSDGRNGHGDGSAAARHIVIHGYEADAKRARDAILELIRPLEAQCELEVAIDARVHGRMVGKGGAGVRDLMKQFGGIHIRFPHGSGTEPVVLRGHRDQCASARAHLLALECQYVRAAAAWRSAGRAAASAPLSRANAAMHECGSCKKLRPRKKRAPSNATTYGIRHRRLRSARHPIGSLDRAGS